ncbi:hypothetical protein VB152_20095, partial [Xanthomonas fragariae]|nr:hypothetical protein [Xanthomonas fragariae]
RMGGNCKKPAFSVANTGSFGTPVQTSRPCGRWVVGVFQGRLKRPPRTLPRGKGKVRLHASPLWGIQGVCDVPGIAGPTSPRPE